MRTHARPFCTALALALVLVASGCAKKTETSSTTGAESTASTAPSESTGAAPGGLTDANIAAIVVAANSADIDTAKLAKSKSKNGDVTGFAQMMITDHSASNAAADSLAKALNLSPQDNATSDDLKKTSDAFRDSLKAMSGTAFDKAYIAHEVAYHEQVLDAIDHTLIPNAQNADLKSLLEKTRPVVASHLDHARSVKKKLGA